MKDEDFLPPLTIPARPPVSLCWADRIALAVFMLFAFAATLMWAAGATEWNGRSLGSSIEALAAVPAVILWVFLRILDFAFGGPGRRSGS